MVLGREIKTESLMRTGIFGSSAFLFERDGHVLLSSVPSDEWSTIEAALPATASTTSLELEVQGERYLADHVDLPGYHPVRLYCLQSYDQATSFLRDLDQMLLILGVVAVGIGALIVFIVSRQITRPLGRPGPGSATDGKRRLRISRFRRKVKTKSQI